MRALWFQPQDGWFKVVTEKGVLRLLNGDLEKLLAALPIMLVRGTWKDRRIASLLLMAGFMVMTRIDKAGLEERLEEMLAALKKGREKDGD